MEGEMVAGALGAALVGGALGWRVAALLPRPMPPIWRSIAFLAWLEVGIEAYRQRLDHPPVISLALTVLAAAVMMRTLTVSHRLGTLRPRPMARATGQAMDRAGRAIGAALWRAVLWGLFWLGMLAVGILIAVLRDG